jgi:hypothetical protein
MTPFFPFVFFPINAGKTTCDSKQPKTWLAFVNSLDFLLDL